MFDERSGEVFIAYHWTEFSQDTINNTSDHSRFCNDDFVVKMKRDRNIIFSKVVYQSYLKDYDPYFHG